MEKKGGRGKREEEKVASVSRRKAASLQPKMKSTRIEQGSSSRQPQKCNRLEDLIDVNNPATLAAIREDKENLACEGSSSKAAMNSSSHQMPKPEILELALDILQKGDSHKIFAAPVDAQKVKGYDKAIKEPMDFSTVREKLQNGAYTSLKSFESDVLLIFRNAMMFNLPSSIFYKEASDLQHLAGRVFHAIRTNPERFKSENSLARKLSGDFCGEKPQTCVPCFAGESNSLASSLFSAPNGFTIIDENFSYSGNLMRFAENLGPTAQKVAYRKIRQGLIGGPSFQAQTQAPSPQAPAAKEKEILGSYSGQVNANHGQTFLEPVVGSNPLANRVHAEPDFVATNNEMGMHDIMQPRQYDRGTGMQVRNEKFPGFVAMMQQGSEFPMASDQMPRNNRMGTHNVVQPLQNDGGMGMHMRNENFPGFVAMMRQGPELPLASRQVPTNNKMGTCDKVQPLRYDGGIGMQVRNEDFPGFLAMMQQGPERPLVSDQMPANSTMGTCDITQPPQNDGGKGIHVRNENTLSFVAMMQRGAELPLASDQVPSNNTMGMRNIIQPLQNNWGMGMQERNENFQGFVALMQQGSELPLAPDQLPTKNTMVTNHIMQPLQNDGGMGMQVRNEKFPGFLALMQQGAKLPLASDQVPLVEGMPFLSNAPFRGQEVFYLNAHLGNTQPSTMLARH